MGLPGLWELWSPGTRELTVSQHSSIFSMESHLVDFISAASEGLKAAPARTLVFGLLVTTAVCTDNMGPEGRLLSMFLNGQALEGEGSKHAEEIAWYNKGLKEVDEHPHAVMEARIERYRNHLLSGDYSGPVFPLRDICRQGPGSLCNKSMFTNDGIENFNRIAMGALKQFPDIHVADMWNITRQTPCSHSHDGKHWDHFTSKKQVDLILAIFKAAGSNY